MSRKRTIALVLLLLLPMLLELAQRGRAQTHHQKTSEPPGDFYAPPVRPRIDVQDSAGHGCHGDRGEITPDLAAQYRADAERQPQDPSAHYNLGRLYLQEGALEKAAYEFDLAASLDPQYASAYVMLGRTLRMQGHYDLALAKLALASRWQPESAIPYIEAGICWDERGFHQQARQQYLKALAVSPHDPDVYNNIGYSFFLEGDYGQAIKQYQKALELAPDDRYANNNIALAYCLKGDFKRAFTHFHRALDPAEAHNNLGFMLLQAGKIKESIEHLQEAVRLDPESARALANLTTALRAAGRYDEAEQAHQQWLSVQKKVLAKTKPVASGQ